MSSTNVMNLTKLVSRKIMTGNMKIISELLNYFMEMITFVFPIFYHIHWNYWEENPSVMGSIFACEYVCFN